MQKNLSCHHFNLQIMASLQMRYFQSTLKSVLTAHNLWSVKYETAASGTTQQYKGRCKSLGNLYIHIIYTCIYVYIHIHTQIGMIK